VSHGGSVLLTQYCSGDKIEKKDMGGACSTYGGEERCIQAFGGGNLKERNHLEDPCVDGRINLLKTKRRLLYLKLQSVPRSKHFISVSYKNQSKPTNTL
jgi:hypothetical protein